MANNLKTKQGANNECYTPPEVFTTLGLQFDLDVAAPQRPISWIPAHKHFSLVDDGLVQPWEGLVWMNPPYSKPSPWVDRFIQHANGIALLPTSTGRWFRVLWQADTAWVMANELRFIKPDGTAYKTTLPTRCWFVAMGGVAKEAIGRLGVVR